MYVNIQQIHNYNVFLWLAGRIWFLTPLITLDNSPWTQVAILGFVTFCSVGMFSAVSGLGAGYVGLQTKHP